MGQRTVLVLPLIALLISCRSPEPPAPVKESVVIGQITSALSLDPYLHNEESTYSTLGHCYESLVAFGPEMELQPQLAMEWENSNDTVLRFQLRKGVFFHDGRPMEAADVVASLQRAQKLEGSKVRHYLQQVREVREIGPGVVEVETSTPAPVLLNMLAFISILPRDTPLQPIEKPIGTGAYRFVSGKPAQIIEGVRFEKYWGKAPAFRRVRIIPLPDAQARAESLTKGTADVVSRFPEDYWGWGMKQSSLRLISRSGLGVVMLGISLRKDSPFQDVRLRQALSLALDRKLIAEEGDKTLGVRMDQVVPPSVFGFDHSLPAFIPDIQRARLLVQQAHPSGELKSDLLLPDSLKKVGESIAAQVQPAGIHLNLVVLSWQEFYARWFESRDPISLFAWSAGSGDASEVFSALAHTAAGNYGNNNLFGYSNPSLDTLIEESERTIKPQQRREMLNRAMRILREDMPVIPVMQRYHLYAMRSDLKWIPRQDRRVCACDMN